MVPRRIAWWVMIPKKIIPTMFSQEPEVGVKCSVIRGLDRDDLVTCPAPNAPSADPPEEPEPQSSARGRMADPRRQLHDLAQRRARCSSPLRPSGTIVCGRLGRLKVVMSKNSWVCSARVRREEGR